MTLSDELLLENFQNTVFPNFIPNVFVTSVQRNAYLLIILMSLKIYTPQNLL